MTINRGSTTVAAGKITTEGNGGHGIEASSLGGGGGNAGLNIIFGFSGGTDGPSGSVADRANPDHDAITWVDNPMHAANANTESRVSDTAGGGEKGQGLDQ